jgi:hypothetical protein
MGGSATLEKNALDARLQPDFSVFRWVPYQGPVHISAVWRRIPAIHDTGSP